MLLPLDRGLCVSFPLFMGFGHQVRLQHLHGWFQSWVPTFFSGGGGRSSVEAWYSSALDLEESLSGAIDSDFHIFVADFVKF